MKVNENCAEMSLFGDGGDVAGWLGTWCGKIALGLMRYTCPVCSGARKLLWAVCCCLRVDWRLPLRVVFCVYSFAIIYTKELSGL